MSRILLRMERPTAGLNHPLPVGFALDQYQRRSHHALVPRLYADSFAEEPWGDDWDAFDEFDPNGIFIANHESQQDPAGFVICFRRPGYGYISVVAVTPLYQRLGIASAMMSRASEYLSSLDLDRVRIDAWEDSDPAVGTYLQLGFEVYERKLEEDT